MYTKEEKKQFCDVTESLKKYRRADLLDEEGKSLLDKLYVDLLPENLVLEKCLLDNTTFLIGRKGTGKSTIFLKLENEYRRKKGFLPCYIDVKTVYESSQAQPVNHEYLNAYFSSPELKKYLLQRTFIQNVLKTIYKEIDEKQQTTWEKIKCSISKNAKNDIKERIKKLIVSIENNNILRSIEVPILQQQRKTIKNENSNSECQTFQAKLPSIKITPTEISLTSDSGVSDNFTVNNSHGEEKEFADIFLKIFEIKSVIEEINSILKGLEIQHLVILLDDVSEIEESALKIFIDTIVAPLNNWSYEFIKFKVAFYPNRIHYGNIDPGKIDIIRLDFYDLYSEFDVNKMAENAILFTERLLTNRFNYYSNNIEQYFDTSRFSMKEYYELLFKVSMNVPRIMGYILSFVYQSKIIYDGLINKADIEKASEKYFDEKIDAFFEKSVYCLLSHTERKSIFELKQLEKLLVDRAKEIKHQIISGKLAGSLYSSSEPYSSHFYVYFEIEKYLESLELNHFITKYEEKSDRDGKKISVYCLNYGLATKNNIIWGRKKGNIYRKYFIERPFNYSKIILNFLSNNKMIICSNCRRTFSEDDLNSGLKFTNMKCPDCGQKVVIESSADIEIENMMKSVSTEIQIPEIEYKILIELSNGINTPTRARDIAEELDFSSRYIAERCKNLDENYGLVIRNKSMSPYTYALSGKGKKFIK